MALTVELGTFVAILLGTITGGMLMSIGPSRGMAVSGAVLLIALLGWLSSRRIPWSAPNAPDVELRFNPVRQTWATVRLARDNRVVLLAILGISWFWLYGALFLTQFPGYARDVLGGDATVATVLLAALSIGIGLGSLLCEWLSAGTIELGLVPIGAAGLTLFALDLFVASPVAVASGLSVTELLTSWPYLRIVVDLVLIGTFGGIYIVPLYALIQQRSKPAQRSRVIAGNNIINALFIVGSAVLAIVLRRAGVSIPQLFAVAGALNLCATVYIFTVIPEFWLRFVVWVMIRAAYRLQRTGVDHISQEGAALLVCNHVSFVDALIISAVCRRPVRFVMHHKFFNIPLMRLLFRAARAIPIAPRHEDEQLMMAALDQVAQALRAGELVCIFPEGKLTSDGSIHPFKSGVEWMLQRTSVPVVPMALRGMWGSFFSRKGGAACRRPFRRWWSKISLVCGEALAPELVTPLTLQQRVSELRGEAR